jgi:hypothetical protein
MKQAQSYTHILRRDPAYWIEKSHEVEKRKVQKQPDIGTYNPNTVSYRLFGNTSNREMKTKSGFGNDSRF